MKEATGELNVTVIVVLAVAMLGAFFYGTIWPMIHDGVEQDTGCDAAWCTSTPDANGYVECCTGEGTITGNTINCTSGVQLTCPYKG